MELYLIRHAQSLNNVVPVEKRVEDPPLSEIGHQQCQYLATRLVSLRLTRLVSSPFLRALQTADHISCPARLIPQVRIDLHEQGGCVSGSGPENYVGRPGMTRRQTCAQFPNFETVDEIDGNGWWASKPIETEDAARQRAARLIACTIEESASTQARVAFVTHGDFQRLLLAQFHFEPLKVPCNASVSKVLAGSSGCRLIEYNRVDHLPQCLIST